LRKNRAAMPLAMDSGSARERQETEAAWIEWLRSFRWDLFATGTWDRPVTGYMALATVQRWLGRYPAAYAIVGLQRGPVSLTHHVHLLIGGVGRSGVRGSWVKRGHMKVEGYHPERGAVEYLVHQAREIELLGSPLSYKLRKRGRRGKRRRS